MTITLIPRGQPFQHPLLSSAKHWSHKTVTGRHVAPLLRFSNTDTTQQRSSRWAGTTLCLVCPAYALTPPVYSLSSCALPKCGQRTAPTPTLQRANSFLAKAPLGLGADKLKTSRTFINIPFLIPQLKAPRVKHHFKSGMCSPLNRSGKLNYNICSHNTAKLNFMLTIANMLSFLKPLRCLHFYLNFCPRRLEMPAKSNLTLTSQHSVNTAHAFELGLSM